MAIALAQSSGNTGVATPATPSSLTVGANNHLVLTVAVVGTSPTIATPAGWTLIKKTEGATISYAMFCFPNAAGGATNPSSALGGGAVTGYTCCMYEYSGIGSSYGLPQGSSMQTSALAQLTNVFQVGILPLSDELVVYGVARATATITAQNSDANWSATVQNKSANGIASDFYWCAGPGNLPTASGLLSGAVASVQIGAWFNSVLSGGRVVNNIGGQVGVYVGQFNQGMIGG